VTAATTAPVAAPIATASPALAPEALAIPQAAAPPAAPKTPAFSKGVRSAQPAPKIETAAKSEEVFSIGIFMRRRVLGRGVVDDKILFLASVLASGADHGWNGESRRL
jgi:hypothetical protein